jgi:hypothetical protein
VFKTLSSKTYTQEETKDYLAKKLRTVRDATEFQRQSPEYHDALEELFAFVQTYKIQQTLNPDTPIPDIVEEIRAFLQSQPPSPDGALMTISPMKRGPLYHLPERFMSNPSDHCRQPPLRHLVDNAMESELVQRRLRVLFEAISRLAGDMIVSDPAIAEFLKDIQSHIATDSPTVVSLPPETGTCTYVHTLQHMGNTPTRRALPMHLSPDVRLTTGGAFQVSRPIGQQLHCTMVSGIGRYSQIEQRINRIVARLLDADILEHHLAAVIYAPTATMARIQIRSLGTLGVSLTESEQRTLLRTQALIQNLEPAREGFWLLSLLSGHLAMSGCCPATDPIGRLGSYAKPGASSKAKRYQAESIREKGYSEIIKLLLTQWREGKLPDYCASPGAVPTMALAEWCHTLEVVMVDLHNDAGLTSLDALADRPWVQDFVRMSLMICFVASHKATPHKEVLHRNVIDLGGYHFNICDGVLACYQATRSRGPLFGSCREEASRDHPLRRSQESGGTAEYDGDLVTDSVS